MQFDILTIFPEVFTSYFKTSIIKRAQDKKKVEINIHNLREWTKDKHKTVDDRPYGGGPGMILKLEPIYKALKTLNKTVDLKNQRIVLLTPQAGQFNQKKAKNLAKKKRIILICGRYEGFDARIKKFVDEEISIGPYVLTGGELPAMAIVDAITRLIPGVIRPESLKEESFSFKSSIPAGVGLTDLEYPQYTRPEVFTYKDNSGNIKKLKVPQILLSGNHQEIKKWKKFFKNKKSVKGNRQN